MIPAEENGEANIVWGFDFKILPIGVHRADRDGLEDTQEAGAANGQPPAHSLNVQKKFACKLVKKDFNPKAANVWGTPSERMTKELAIVKCMRIKRVNLSLCLMR